MLESNLVANFWLNLPKKTSFLAFHLNHNLAILLKNSFDAGSESFASNLKLAKKLSWEQIFAAWIKWHLKFFSSFKKKKKSFFIHKSKKNDEKDKKRINNFYESHCIQIISLKSRRKSCTETLLRGTINEQRLEAATIQYLLQDFLSTQIFKKVVSAFFFFHFRQWDIMAYHLH